MIGPFKAISRMTPEELEATFGEDAYWIIGLVIWRWLRLFLLVASLVGVAAILSFLPSMRPFLRNTLAAAIVIYATTLAMYFVWSELILRCLHIESLRRIRHSTFNTNSIHGEIGGAVALQVVFVLLIVVAGYISIAIVYGAAYFGTGGSTASSSFADSVYFSFVTFGTVGYGDFQPRGFGKILVCMHTVSYLLYQVTAVAGLIAIISKITTEPNIGLGFTLEGDPNDESG
jgi:hypothetical protein